MGFPGGGSAYEIGGMVVFQGNTASISVFQHEVGHAVDAYNNADGTSSSKPIFAEALKKDKCVPDAYANTSMYKCLCTLFSLGRRLIVS